MLGAALLLSAAVVTVGGPPGIAAEWEARVRVLAGQVEGALGFRYEGPLRVELAPTEEEFRRLAPSAPDWAAAVARAREARLVVRLTATGPETGTDVAGVLRHELVHLMLPERVGGFDRVPLWFEEGLAQLTGARILSESPARLKVAEAAGRLLPLDALADRFPPGRTAASLAYAQAESVLGLLVERRGTAGLREMLDRLRETGSFERALADTYGTTVAELEEDWRSWLGGSGPPWWLATLLATFIPFLLFVASLLVVVGFLRARRRQRETYEGLPE